MKSFLTALIILVLAVSSIGLADAAETLPTANQCRTADASNKLLTPDKKYSAYEIFIQLRQGTFGDSPLNLPLMPVKNKNENKSKKKNAKVEAVPKVNPGIADFEKKVKVLNELRREAGLKFLTLADIKSKPSVVYETNDRLLEIRDRINWQKSRLDLVLVKCEQIKFKKRLEAAFRKQQQEAMQQAAAGTGPNTSAENTVSER